MHSKLAWSWPELDKKHTFFFFSKNGMRISRENTITCVRLDSVWSLFDIQRNPTWKTHWHPGDTDTIATHNLISRVTVDNNINLVYCTWDLCRTVSSTKLKESICMFYLPHALPWTTPGSYFSVFVIVSAFITSEGDVWTSSGCDGEAAAIMARRNSFICRGIHQQTLPCLFIFSGLLITSNPKRLIKEEFTVF